MPSLPFDAREGHPPTLIDAADHAAEHYAQTGSDVCWCEVADIREVSASPSWAELETQFGKDAIRVIDRAICEQLAQSTPRHPDNYLISEGLTFAVLIAMRREGLRFTGSIAAVRDRVKCPTCGRNVALRTDGTFRLHNRADGEWGRCPMSRRDPERGA